MRTLVSHEVMFLLEDGEGPVVPMDGVAGYARLENVIIRLSDRAPHVHISGHRCRKNGEPDRRMGNHTVGVLITAEATAEWVARAARAARQLRIGQRTMTPPTSRMTAPTGGTVEPYGDPAVDAIIPEIREYIVANFMDGEDGGLLTIPNARLADEMAEIVAVWHVERQRSGGIVEWWPLSRLLLSVRPGSQGDDWTWTDEYNHLMSPEYRERTEALGHDLSLNRQREPILIGTDGRLWDGHHRVICAMWLGIDRVLVEVAQSGRSDG